MTSDALTSPAAIVEKIIDAGAQHLFGERKPVLASALARVACETWMAIEIAAVVESSQPPIVPHGWGVFVEKGRMDLSVLPLGSGKPNPSDPDGLFIELKLLTAAENFNDGLKQLRGDHKKLTKREHAFEATLMFDVFPKNTACRWARPVRKAVMSLQDAFFKVQESCSFLKHLRCWGPVTLEHAWYDGTVRLDLWRHDLPR